VRASVEITDLNLSRKSATLRTRCMVKEDVVIEGESIVLVPTRA
jgi:3-hydroxybutyryl-CoA dehydratase